MALQHTNDELVQDKSYSNGRLGASRDEGTSKVEARFEQLARLEAPSSISCKPNLRNGASKNVVNNDAGAIDDNLGDGDDSDNNDADTSCKSEIGGIRQNRTEPDKADESSVRDGQLGDDRQTGLERLPLIVDSSDTIWPATIVIKSCLKKAGSSKPVDGSSRASHNRNVTFNQTVIVFCEEIETSSPSETFDPPLDYQDASSPINEGNLSRLGDETDLAKSRGLQRKDRKQLDVRASYLDANEDENDEVDDDKEDEFDNDIDFISKIVGNDASNLTDDQLIGLIESNSLLKNFHLNDSNNDAYEAIDRLNSTHGYLGQAAISDESESDSSLLTGARNKVDRTRHLGKPKFSTTPKESDLVATPTKSVANTENTVKIPSKSDQDTTSSERNDTQSVDIRLDQVRTSSTSARPRSMPARVKVSTVDNNSRRQAPVSTVAVHREAVVVIETKKSTNKTTSVSQSNESQLVISSSKQNSSSAHNRSDPLRLEIFDSPQVVLSKSHIVGSSSCDNVGTLRHQAQTYSANDSTRTISKPISKNQFLAYNDQTSLRNINPSNQIERNELTNPHQKINPTSNDQIQGGVSNPSSCHICQAIESSRHQANCAPRVDKSTSAVNNNSSIHLDTNTNHSTQTNLTQQQHYWVAQNHLHITNGSNELYQKPLQPVQPATNYQSSCLSCNELTSQQQQISIPKQQTALKNPIAQLPVKPIACQLVYVVDQYGNRMKALQVVAPSQVGNTSGVAGGQLTSCVINNYSNTTPTLVSGQNLVRVINPNQILSTAQTARVISNESNSDFTKDRQRAQYMKEGLTQARSIQQERMQVLSHAAPKNHTIYYMRQPLDEQNFQHASDIAIKYPQKSFPDAHEVRRLDGIKAPAASPVLNVRTHQLSESEITDQMFNQTYGNKADGQNKISRRKDDSDDPTFGFSRRPAVKVVSSAQREISNTLTNYNNEDLTTGSRIHFGSHTLGRKSANRDQTAQREYKETIPSTSSMTNINRTLSEYTGVTNHVKQHETSAKSKESSVGHVAIKETLDTQTDSSAHLKQEEQNQNTSVVNFAEPLGQQFQHHLRQTPKLQSQSLSQSVKIDRPQHQQHQPQTNQNDQQHDYQNYHHQHQSHHDMNSVIGIDVTPSQPTGYAIPPIPPQTHSFGPPPPPPHVYGGPPIFQPYTTHYFIPYNIQPYPMPLVLPPNNQVVPNRQVPSQTSQPPSTNSINTNSRSHPHHLRTNKSKELAKQHPHPQHQHHNENNLPSQQQSGDLNVNVASNTNSNRLSDVPPKNDELTIKASTNEANSDNTMSKVTNSSDHAQQERPQVEMLISNGLERQESGENVKVSSDEGFDTQSSLNISKQSQESSSIVGNENAKPSQGDSNDSGTDQSIRESTDSIDRDGKSQKNKDNNKAPAGPWGSAASKSWASLFKGEVGAYPNTCLNGDSERNNMDSDNSEGEDAKNNRTGRNRSNNNTKSGSASSEEQRSQDAARRALDKMAPKLAQKINSITLKHSLPLLRPRGFINKGNGCYINSTLQALIACPPFYNLMKEIGDLRGTKRENSCTPILDSFVELFLNFPPLDANKKNKQSTSVDQKLQMNYLQAEAIEPRCIYNVLGQIKSECLRGAQEDAEEFLSSVLNGLHEEMIGLSETLQNAQENSTNQNGHLSDAEEIMGDLNNDENLWREVGPKNRSLPIRTATVINTPIQEIFGGSLFSIRTAGKDRCGHRSPFFDLQLDISSDNVKSLQDAIKSFTATETIQDFYCTKTKQKLDAQRRTSLDQLPPILILHLKQFVYTQDHGLKKLMKRIEYPIDFELPDSCLHDKNSDKSLRNSRTYKLLAVVYHEGKETVKGHYLTDVYHIGSSQWIRCDDSNLKVVPAPRIENPDSSRTPYLLFYRRLNTLGPRQSNSHDNKKKI